MLMPIPCQENCCQLERTPATLQPGEEIKRETETDLPTSQWRDKDLAVIIEYLETGILPPEEGLARTLVLSESQYVLEDDVLYKIEQNSTLQLIPPRIRGSDSSKTPMEECLGHTSVI